MASIESTFSEENYLVGEALYDNGCVESATKLPANTWEIIVQHDGYHTVIIKSYQAKKQKNSCNCETFSEHKECQHIVASLLHLRSVVSLSTDRTTKKYTAVNIKNILEVTTHDELKKFIRSASKSDRNLNFMLRAAFAYKIQSDDDAKKYSDLVNTLVKPVSSSNASTSNSDTRLAVKILEELRDQLSDAITLEQYTHAFDIIRGTFGKIHYLYRHYTSTRNATLKLLLDYNAFIESLYRITLAPALLDQLDETLVEVASYSYYNYVDNDREIAFLLHKFNRNRALANLADLLADTYIINTSETEKPVLVAIWKLLKLPLPRKLDLTDHQKVLASNMLMDWQLKEQAVDYLLSYLNKDRNRTLEHAVIELYDKAGRKKEAVEMASEIFTKFKEFRYLKVLKNLNGGMLDQKLIIKLSNAIASINRSYRFKATYFREVEDIDQLVNTLEESLDLQLIMEHDAYLYSKSYIALENIYLQGVEKYLSTHAGSMAFRFLNEVFAHLMQVKASKLIPTIKQYIAREHNHRSGFGNYGEFKQ